MPNFPKLPPDDEHKTTFSRPLHSELRNETRKQCEKHNKKQWKLFITNSRENKHKRSFFHGSLEARIRSLTQLGQLPNTGPKVPISRLAMTLGGGGGIIMPHESWSNNIPQRSLGVMKLSYLWTLGRRYHLTCTC